jgi:hypothetical protein
MGMTGQQIWENFHVHATGPEGLHNGGHTLDSVAKSHRELGERIKRLVTKLESDWVGDAGEAASRGAGPMAVEFLAASHELKTGQDLLHRQGDAFTRAKGKVVKPPPRPPVVATRSAADSFDQAYGRSGKSVLQ